MLNRHHNFAFIALMEPFLEGNQIHKYKRRLGMSYATHNQNVKIWVFVQDHIHVGVISNTDQQLTLQLHFQDTGDIILATVIYAKCDALERINMWDDIYNISVNYNMPWLVGGDFNVIMSDEEKTGGLPVYPHTPRHMKIFPSA